MPDIRGSVEDFAALRASMDDPFGDPAASLARAGIDERSYAELTSAWRARLVHERETGSDLGRRFAIAYREAVTARRARAGKEATVREEDARFLSRDVQPWRAEAAPVALLASSSPPPPGVASRSAEVAPLAAESAARDAPSPAPGLRSYGGRDRSSDEPWETETMLAASSGDEPSETSTLPVRSSVLSAQVLPFAAPRAGLPATPPTAPRDSLAALPFRPSTLEPSTAPAPHPSTIPAHLADAIPAEGPLAPPNKRLIRFDPQTGQPLPFPLWVDVAPVGTGEKR